MFAITRDKYPSAAGESVFDVGQFWEFHKDDDTGGFLFVVPYPFLVRLTRHSGEQFFVAFGDKKDRDKLFSDLMAKFNRKD